MASAQEQELVFEDLGNLSEGDSDWEILSATSGSHLSPHPSCDGDETAFPDRKEVEMEPEPEPVLSAPSISSPIPLSSSEGQTGENPETEELKEAMAIWKQQTRGREKIVGREMKQVGVKEVSVDISTPPSHSVPSSLSSSPICYPIRRRTSSKIPHLSAMRSSSAPSTSPTSSPSAPLPLFPPTPALAYCTQMFALFSVSMMLFQNLEHIWTTVRPAASSSMEPLLSSSSSKLASLPLPYPMSSLYMMPIASNLTFTSEYSLTPSVLSLSLADVESRLTIPVIHITPSSQLSVPISSSKREQEGDHQAQQDKVLLYDISSSPSSTDSAPTPASRTCFEDCYTPCDQSCALDCGEVEGGKGGKEGKGRDPTALFCLSNCRQSCLPTCRHTCDKRKGISLVATNNAACSSQCMKVCTWATTTCEGLCNQWCHKEV